MIFTLLSIFILLFSVSLHEAAHGWVAYKMGDPTPKYAGRISLNPIRHLDLMGSLIVPGFMLLLSLRTGVRVPVFGWAKPVPINPHNFRNRSRGELLSALAGPLSNISLGVIGGLAARLTPIDSLGFYLAAALSLTNFSLAVFNLIPIPPLDGSHILLNLWPGERWKIEGFLKAYGPVFFIIFIFFGINLIAPIVYRMFYLTAGTGIP